MREAIWLSLRNSGIVQYAWRGAAVPVGELEQTVRGAGGTVREVRGENSLQTWFRGGKSSSQV